MNCTRRKFLKGAALVVASVGLGRWVWRGRESAWAQGRVCASCGAEYEMEHEYEGRRYCPNCGGG
jgi:PHP family Zn ribbon phosphoesterase